MTVESVSYLSIHMQIECQMSDTNSSFERRVGSTQTLQQGGKTRYNFKHLRIVMLKIVTVLFHDLSNTVMRERESKYKKHMKPSYQDV